MRLVDTDAEIEKIDDEIKRIKERIATWEKRKKEDDTGRFDADAKIMEQMSNLADCIREKRILESYETAFDVDSVIAQLESRKKRAVSLIEESTSEYFEGEAYAYEVAIRIVKGGGIE